MSLRRAKLAQLHREAQDTRFNSTLAHLKLTKNLNTFIQLVCLICELLVSLWGDCRMDIHRKGGPAAGQNIHCVKCIYAKSIAQFYQGWDKLQFSAVSYSIDI